MLWLGELSRATLPKQLYFLLHSLLFRRLFSWPYES